MHKLLSILLVVGLGISTISSTPAADGRTRYERADMAERSGTESAVLKITVREKSFTTPLIDSQTARDFVRLLPLTLRMSDINKREKYSGLTTSLAKEGAVSTTYQVGDLSYWLGGGIAAFYNHDGREVKAGLIVLAKLGDQAALFSGTGSVNVTFEVAPGKM